MVRLILVKKYLRGVKEVNNFATDLKLDIAIFERSITVVISFFYRRIPQP